MPALRRATVSTRLTAKGYILQKSTANCCGGVTFHPNEGKEEHYNLNGGGPPSAHG